ncbi:MAG TPA: VOC family protein [bacterium]|nr:VOC family protein [bacterium]
MSTLLSLSEIGQISIPVHDVARATDFYRDRLGMRYLFSAPPGLAFFACGTVRLMLSRPEGPEGGLGSSTLYFRVTKIEQAYRVLQDRGVRFHGAPHLIAKMDTHDLWMAFFHDSEDNVLALMEEVPRR